MGNKEKIKKARIGRIKEDRDFYRVVPTFSARVTMRQPMEEESAENLLAKVVVNTAYQIHTALGPGLLERVYEVILAHELRQLGHTVNRQVPIPISYRGIQFEEGYVADLIVADTLIVELKSVEALLPVHAKQLLTQLRLTDKKLGLLINFGAATLKGNVRRLANGM